MEVSHTPAPAALSFSSGSRTYPRLKVPIPTYESTKAYNADFYGNNPDNIKFTFIIISIHNHSHLAVVRNKAH